jgi:hypothetical protein
VYEEIKQATKGLENCLFTNVENRSPSMKLSNMTSLEEDCYPHNAIRNVKGCCSNTKNCCSNTKHVIENPVDHFNHIVSEDNDHFFNGWCILDTMDSKAINQSMITDSTSEKPKSYESSEIPESYESFEKSKSVESKYKHLKFFPYFSKLDEEI